MSNNKQKDRTMLVGVGIDLVSIENVKDLDERTKHAFTDRTFTDEEKKEASKASDKFEYYAGRYAVKEAVYKAIAFACSCPFDFRMIETLNDVNGKPYVVMNPDFCRICEDAGVSDVLISISHEGGFVIAIAEAVNE